MDDKFCHYLSFRVGHEWYGVDVKDVIEVLHMVALNEFPGTDILGALTLRDQVMPVIDLRQRFGLDASELTLSTPIIAIRTARGGVGLVVDEADNVEHIPREMLIEYKSTYTHQVARLERGLLLLLDVSQLEDSIQPVQS
jgi:purine-binding chemotaxis protein CheW